MKDLMKKEKGMVLPFPFYKMWQLNTKQIISLQHKTPEFLQE